MKKVSIVIVCMNNMRNIIPCLDSIKKYTKVDYQVWLIAYMFSKENLQKIKTDYPELKIIDNNEISGFSENNNLALRQIDTKFALVLNDDTILTEPVVDELIASFEETPDAVTMSPKIVNRDGSYQTCGRNPFTWKDFIKEFSFGIDIETKPSKYINGNGIFQSYNITGACFLIKTEDFRRLGFFDEYYFFSPEDIALSTKINEEGGKCYVDSSIRLIHLGGGTTKSAMKMATLPSELLGCIHFYGRNSLLLRFFLRMWFFATAIGKSIIFSLEKKDIDKKAQKNIVATVISRQTPKQVFCKYYKHLICK